MRLQHRIGICIRDYDSQLSVTRILSLLTSLKILLPNRQLSIDLADSFLSRLLTQSSREKSLCRLIWGSSFVPISSYIAPFQATLLVFKKLQVSNIQYPVINIKFQECTSKVMCNHRSSTRISTIMKVLQDSWSVLQKTSKKNLSASFYQRNFRTFVRFSWRSRNYIRKSKRWSHGFNELSNSSNSRCYSSSIIKARDTSLTPLWGRSFHLPAQSLNLSLRITIQTPVLRALRSPSIVD